VLSHLSDARSLLNHHFERNRREKDRAMGWTYNTPDDVPNDGPQITAIAIVFTAVSFLVLTLRFYVRGCMIKAIGAGTYCGTNLLSTYD
jgi:hypothetical protein